MVRISARPLTILTFVIPMHPVVFSISQTNKKYAVQHNTVKPYTTMRHVFQEPSSGTSFLQQFQNVGTFGQAVILFVRFH